MILENDILKLRAVEPEDLEKLYKWENDTRLWIHGNNLSPYSKLTLRQYILDAQNQDIYQVKQLRLMLVLKKDNTTVGTVDLYDYDVRNMRVGTGILVDEEFRQHNYASQCLEIIKEYAFKFLHIHQLYAYILVGNEASKGLFRKAGFRECGILKEWVYTGKRYEDVNLFQLINKEDE